MLPSANASTMAARIILAVASAVVSAQSSPTLREAGKLAGVYMGSQFKYDSIFNSSIAPGSAR